MILSCTGLNIFQCILQNSFSIYQASRVSRVLYLSYASSQTAHRLSAFHKPQKDSFHEKKNLCKAKKDKIQTRVKNFFQSLHS